MKIGICGGTFDPFHRGHLEPVLAARGLFGWDLLLYIPAYRQPFKAGQHATSGYHRFTMAVLATETIEIIHVTPMELDRGATSYTVDTLELLRAEYPQATLDWIIGDDNLEKLSEWKNLKRIFELANFAVLTRTGMEDRPSRLSQQAGMPVLQPAQRSTRGSVAFAENATVPVSSTEIRRRIRAGEPIGGLVDPRVSHYIEHNRLYREA